MMKRLALSLTALVWAVPLPAAAQAGRASGSPAIPGRLAITGRIAILEKDNKPSPDLGTALVYLEGRGAGGGARAGRYEVTISEKGFSPHVLVIPVGSTVSFPNHDPFDHNVFSVSEPNGFDLGLYGRGEGKLFTFKHPGLVRVFCNVHPRMAALVQVMATNQYAQPGADGTFTIPGVEPGTYRLHVWHERAPSEVIKEVTVGPQGLADVQVTLNARGFRVQPHKNKYGRDYPTNTGRERY